MQPISMLGLMQPIMTRRCKQLFLHTNSYRPGRGNSTLVHLFGFVASNGGADAADINGGADAADNDTTMQATFLYTNLILVVKVNATRSRPIH
jgi:hypothetical protein